MVGKATIRRGDQAGLAQRVQDEPSLGEGLVQWRLIKLDLQGGMAIRLGLGTGSRFRWTRVQ